MNFLSPKSSVINMTSSAVINSTYLVWQVGKHGQTCVWLCSRTNSVELTSRLLAMQWSQSQNIQIIVVPHVHCENKVSWKVRLLSILSVHIIKCALFAESKVRFARAEQLWFKWQLKDCVAFWSVWLWHCGVTVVRRGEGDGSWRNGDMCAARRLSRGL